MEHCIVLTKRVPDVKSNCLVITGQFWAAQFFAKLSRFPFSPSISRFFYWFSPFKICAEQTLYVRSTRNPETGFRVNNDTFTIISNNFIYFDIIEIFLYYSDCYLRLYI